jgi:hypothetical protein
MTEIQHQNGTICRRLSSEDDDATETPATSPKLETKPENLCDYSTDKELAENQWRSLHSPQ